MKIEDKTKPELIEELRGLRQRVRELETAEEARQRAEEELLRQRRKLRALASELTLAEERERRRLARDLHDEVGQRLAILRVKLGDSEPAFEELRGLIGQALDSTRSLTCELGLPVLYELGLEAALDSLAEKTEKRQGLRVIFAADDHPKPLAPETEVVLFRVVRELLINVVKHARARRAEVSVARSGDLIRITVADDGVGFDPAEIAARASANGSFGLFSARERLAHFGGSFELESKTGVGTRVIVAAPLGDTEEKR